MSRLLQDVVGELSNRPGRGRRTALRLAIHILRMERESVAEMTESIDRFRNEVKYCTQCNNLSDEDVCPICADDERDHTTICVVEQVADVRIGAKTPRLGTGSRSRIPTSTRAFTTCWAGSFRRCRAFRPRI